MKSLNKEFMTKCPVAGAYDDWW